MHDGTRRATDGRSVGGFGGGSGAGPPADLRTGAPLDRPPARHRHRRQLVDRRRLLTEAARMHAWQHRTGGGPLGYYRRLGSMALLRSSSVSSRWTRVRALASRVSRLVPVSQTRAVRSRDAVAIRCPSGDQATAATTSSWPWRTASSAPAAAHTRTVRSLDAV